MRASRAGWRLAAQNIETAGDVGGTVVAMTAGAALKIGDVVYLSAAKTVNKTLVAATNLKMVGVVVGGPLVGDFNEVAQDDDNLIGVTCCAAGDTVLVAVSGIVKCLSDAAITLGDKVTAASATTAGRIKTASVTTDAAAGDTGRIVGLALNTVGAAGSIVSVLLQVGT